MFRNGIIVGRRPVLLAKPLSSSPSTATSTSIKRHELLLPFLSLFVCTNCQAQQARAMASYASSKPFRKRKDESSMASQIKRLEAHVQEMEKKYVEALRQRALEKVAPPPPPQSNSKIGLRGGTN